MAFRDFKLNLLENALTPHLNVWQVREPNGEMAGRHQNVLMFGVTAQEIVHMSCGLASPLWIGDSGTRNAEVDVTTGWQARGGGLRGEVSVLQKACDLIWLHLVSVM